MKLAAPRMVKARRFQLEPELAVSVAVEAGSSSIPVYTEKKCMLRVV